MHGHAPMQDGVAPWKLQLKPRPLPYQRAAAAAGSGTAAEGADATEADDELDQLTSLYAAEAEADAKATATKHAVSRQPPQKGMQQLRTEGLATALPQDNKYTQLCLGHA